MNKISPLTENDIKEITREAFYDNNDFEEIKKEFKRLAKI